MNICLIDNYDSFTFNIEHQFQMLEQSVEVIRNDATTIDELTKMDFDAFVIGPGPSNPTNAGISMDVIKSFYKTKPILGICLGHQAIGQSFGGKIVIANRIMHGKTSLVSHNKDSLFFNVKDPYHVMRYHSLAIEVSSLPNDLKIIAWTEDEKNKTIMAVKHKDYPVIGIQFHPESIFTEQGSKLIQNFLDLI
ncbi:MAG: anthranilate synthase component II [Gammaproteobacteria bacterium]|jgi:anthranilate synthase component 2|uniref:Aminodeoxychorismate/anthranilate synthase component II n=1 Tax=SAR86 cluster bacterium TaxID=2030880 RepID=A0A520N083_9GAMM|nr:aminodeoxychorismate/anthranilate synthase component II [Gammaproteobacteria bacterium]MBA4729604.1 aminodeoxychorismate/anthranilate synthase component II [SAR86 cluster bacterium]RZO26902.1 MAG: aminodeoxychorismate/anthranilate synthase component II [SAR86 cluster bacterium]|tara:strand:+ start:5970 stop:6548 length:579 start_codon:yes stop_codon:yes gene_type:complete